MSRWVRLWADMPTDPKFRAVARKAGRPLAEVMALFVLMMTAADAESGVLANWSDDDAAAALDTDEAHVAAIREAMQGKVLDGLALSGWERRQPKRQDDNSTNRVRQWREKKQAEKVASETPVSDHPVRDETHMKRNETHGDAPDTETETDKVCSSEQTNARAPDAIPSEFAQAFWPAYPHKVGKPDAEKKFRAARKVASLEQIMAGLNRYIASKPPDRQWCNPSTWLNQHRWADQPAAQPAQIINPSFPRQERRNGHAISDALAELHAIAEAAEHGGFPPTGRGFGH